MTEIQALEFLECHANLRRASQTGKVRELGKFFGEVGKSLAVLQMGHFTET